MQKQPLVSVIVPVYNVAPYLEKCLNSLVNQDLQDIEIIIVNDGSTDNSQSIIDDFQLKYPHKIKSFAKANGGLSDARNFGLNKACGEYIGFVDSDDYVTTKMYREMYTLAVKYNADMVICNLQKIDENGNVIKKLTQIPNLPERIDVAKHISLFSDLSYFACNKLFKKELFQQAKFQKDLHFEDIQLVPQLLLKCSIVAQTQAYHYQYLERVNSISKTHTTKGLDILKAVEDVSHAFRQSQYKHHEKALKNFQILEGVYTYLAYLAFVKKEDDYQMMSQQLRKFIKENGIKFKEILTYTRFGQNYLLSLPLRKKIYYLLYFFHQESLLRRLLR